MAFFWVIATLAGRLTLAAVRMVAYMAWVSGLFGAAMLLLQGVAQLEGEGLAKVPETEAALRGRLIIVAIFFVAGFCGRLVCQTARFLSPGKGGDCRSRLLRAVFEGSVFWGGTCLFLCLLILAGSLQARWKVPTEYYWLAGGAGILLLLLFGAAELAHRRLTAGKESA